MNLIRALDGCLAPRCSIYAAALAASAESFENFRSAGITPVFLASSDGIVGCSAPELPAPDRAVIPRKPDRITHVNSIYDPRLGVHADSFLAECSSFARALPGRSPLLAQLR